MNDPPFASAPPRPEHAAGPDRDPLAARCRHELLAGELAHAVDAKWPRGILLDVGAARLPVEDVVGGDVNQERPNRLGGVRKVPRSRRVHGECRHRLALRGVDPDVGRRVEEDVRPHASHDSSHRIAIGDVQLLTVARPGQSILE